VYGKYVCILRMLCVLSSFPRSKLETLLPPHAVALVLPFRRLPGRVFAPVLPFRRLLEAAAQDARNLIPALRTFCRCRLVIKSKWGRVFGKQVNSQPLSRQHARPRGNRMCRKSSRVTYIIYRIKPHAECSRK
jgi:hypothetical protein